MSPVRSAAALAATLAWAGAQTAQGSPYTKVFAMYEPPLDEARRRVRAWERAQTHYWMPGGPK